MKEAALRKFVGQYVRVHFTASSMKASPFIELAYDEHFGTFMFQSGKDGVEYHFTCESVRGISVEATDA